MKKIYNKIGIFVNQSKGKNNNKCIIGRIHKIGNFIKSENIEGRNKTKKIIKNSKII